MKQNLLFDDGTPKKKQHSHTILNSTHLQNEETEKKEQTPMHQKISLNFTTDEHQIFVNKF